ncbi:type I-E CRISPR-associated protein Cas7/Cse4/CasC [Kitasatospora sp. NBC_00458]|uniref:type I-E CRISPR-associated protein Cas7/Cse4/CasC n=1 Tax=Kitasatospora sp. NBC_00458 TaxID=2903568 RepID=UPI002E197116
MTRTILDVHVLQTVPPSNLNRDDTGAPKSAVYGGVRRARVSSQAWKRATRQAFDGLLDPAELGVRTKKAAELLAARIIARGVELKEPEAWQAAAETITAATGAKVEPPKRKKDSAARNGDEDPAPESAYLLFLSDRQLDALADLAAEALNGPGGQGGPGGVKEFFKAKENRARAREAANTRHSVDIALFGRMVADASDINVDAAAQVAHAISVHAVENESDYFTAVDDQRGDDEPGAGMIGIVDFNSATLYRYAAVDVDGLKKNLGDGMRPDEPATEPVRRAVQAFVEAFVTSIPSGKMNTFANQTLPDAVIVKLRSARPISFAGAFEEAVLPGGGGLTGGHVAAACAQLAAYVPEVERAFGAVTEESWVLRVGERTAPLSDLGTDVGLRELVEAVGTAVAGRLGPDA